MVGKKVADELWGTGQDLLVSLGLDDLVENVVREEEVIDLLPLLGRVGAGHWVGELVE